MICDEPIHPYLMLGSLQRRAFRAGLPALLFTNVEGTPYSVVANLFGTIERVEFLFKDALPNLRALLALKAEPLQALKNPKVLCKALPAIFHSRVRMVKRTALTQSISLKALPQLVSWKDDGGAYITLPQVYTEDPLKEGMQHSNVGMYRIQISSDHLTEDTISLHYQIHRGIAGHHANAIKSGVNLPVNIAIGGFPAMTIAAIMPLPEGVPEVFFAGALAGKRIPFVRAINGLPMPATADFCISGYITQELTQEGPFGDHLGYYSLAHPFPTIKVQRIYARRDAIFPFTTVGRPPQEDTVFGDFIHSLTHEIVPRTFAGITELHAVDAAGVHPLLLAIAQERYTPYSTKKKPEEIITAALGLLGSSQTSLAKYLFVAAYEDAPALSTRDIPGFFRHMLERIRYDRDLHFITQTTMDTLDYTGCDFNRGSKVMCCVAGGKVRSLKHTLPMGFSLPPNFCDPVIFFPGILLVKGSNNTANRGERSSDCVQLAEHFARSFVLEGIALCVIVDDTQFTAKNWENFLWVTFTRSNPAVDIYGVREYFHNKHWGCEAPCIIDARKKPFHAPELVEDEYVERQVDAYIAKSSVLKRFL